MKIVAQRRRLTAEEIERIIRPPILAYDGFGNAYETYTTWFHWQTRLEPFSDAEMYRHG